MAGEKNVPAKQLFEAAQVNIWPPFNRRAPPGVRPWHQKRAQLELKKLLAGKPPPILPRPLGAVSLLKQRHLQQLTDGQNIKGVVGKAVDRRVAAAAASERLGRSSVVRESRPRPV